MKSPDTIYFDEIIREVKRNSRAGKHAGAPRLIEPAALESANCRAAEAAAYHLVDYLGFSVAEAESAAEEFMSIGPDPVRLRHTWTDIQLKRTRRR
jgi:hypothetical protein